MSSQTPDPQEAGLWQRKQEAAAAYTAQRGRLEELDQELRRRFAAVRGADLPAWRELVARRNQARRDARVAREAEERAADRWAEHVLRGG